jgi:hypothetical protein
MECSLANCRSATTNFSTITLACPKLTGQADAKATIEACLPFRRKPNDQRREIIPGEILSGPQFNKPLADEALVAVIDCVESHWSKMVREGKLCLGNGKCTSPKVSSVQRRLGVVSTHVSK